MWILWIGLVCLLLCSAVIITAFICYRMAFFVKKEDKIPKNEFDLPPGKIYEPYREQMVTWMKEVKQLPCNTYTVTSFDGLTLHGKYYECRKGAPIELMFHGYRGSAQRDLCGGVQRCFALGRNVLIVDQRAAGRSGGQVISFGINESKDCLVWIDLLKREFGDQVKIMLTGISMGAATVMMAADQASPDNVVGILADCGYSSPKAIIKKVITQMGLPADLLFPFVKLGAKWFGKFDLNEHDPLRAVQNSKRPILFVHGDTDDYVPCEMSQQLYACCGSEKRLHIVHGAGHGLAYLKDQATYLKVLAEFSALCGIPVDSYLQDHLCPLP